MPSYVFKTTSNGAKVKMTFRIRCDVSKQTLTLTRTRCHFPVYPLIFLKKSPLLYGKYVVKDERSKVNHTALSYAIYTAKLMFLLSFYLFFNSCRRQKAANVFFSQNQSSFSERDFLAPCNMHLTPCNMRKLLHGYFNVK